MREHKFRAWDKEKKQFAYLLIGHHSNSPIIQPTGDWCLDSWDQYTGIKDKNGVEVYDGDIVEFAELSGTSDPLNSDNYIKKAIVVMYVGDILLPHFVNLDDELDKCFITAKVVESVLGNIYENKELLIKEN